MTPFWARLPGADVCVPDDLACMTAYVLCEQGDWFEDELPFVRRVLQPGDRVVDVGANYGVYALSAARCVGPEGRVWAFEPASSTAKHLRASARRNGFQQLTVIEAALSNRAGSAHLSDRPQAELNALLRAEAGEATQAVDVQTLDGCAADEDWRGLSLLKLDAEGEETRILSGGARLLTAESPLILFEIKHAHTLDLGLVDVLASYGYTAYRLVPGLGLLTPFRLGEPIDPYLLNLFACKPDRAATLAARGLLAKGTQEPEPVDPALWRVHLGALPWGHGRDWPEPTYAEALSHVARAGVSTLAPGLRLGHLERALALLARKQTRSAPRLATWARVTRMLGRRMAAVELLDELAGLTKTLTHDPCLPPEPRFDRLSPGDRRELALRAATLEARERLSTFSSYFSGCSTAATLRELNALGFGGPAARRLQAIELRAAGTRPSEGWRETPEGLEA